MLAFAGCHRFEFALGRREKQVLCPAQPQLAGGNDFLLDCSSCGSITIASEKPTEDDDFPKGFYLRRIKGVLWLRGYCSGPQHVWDADNHVVLVNHKGPVAVTNHALMFGQFILMSTWYNPEVPRKCCASWEEDKLVGSMGANIEWPKKQRELHNHRFDSTIWNGLSFREDGGFT